MSTGGKIPALPVFLFTGAEGAGALVGGDALPAVAGFLVEGVELWVPEAGGSLDLRRGAPGFGGSFFAWSTRWR